MIGNRSFISLYMPVALALTSMVALAPFAHAQKMAPKKSPAKAAPAKAPAANLPTAAKVMDDALAASGGKGVMEKFTSQVAHGTIELPAQKITGTFEQKIKLPDKIWASQTIKGIGTLEQGYDGTKGWARDPINGLRDLPASEVTQLKTPLDELKNDNWRQQYKKVEMLGLRKVGNTTAYAIRQIPARAGAHPVVTFYDVKTKLPVRTDIVIESPQGSVPTQNFLSDYRTVSGMKIPFLTRQVMATVETKIIMTSIEFNVPVEDSVFTKPVAAAPKAP